MSTFDDQELEDIQQAVVILKNVIDRNFKNPTRTYLNFLLSTIASYIVSK